MNDKMLLLAEREFGSEISFESSDPPLAVPENTDVLSRLIQFACGNGIKICVSGGGTGITPFPLKDSIWVSTRKLNKIKEINAGDFLLSAESGVIADDAVNAARGKGFCLPLELPSGGMSTLGGAYMTDAWGLTAKVHGSFRDSVIGVKCLTSEGKSVSFGGRTAKNVTGYEITRFLAGSYAIICRGL